MATRPGKKTSAAPVRRSMSRREQQVQGLDDKTIQALKAALADIQKALDSYGNSRPERLGGSVWADLHTRSGAFIGTIYHSLPQQLLSKVGVLDVRVESSSRSIPRGGGENIPPYPPVVSGRVSGNAGVSVQEYNSLIARGRLSKVQGRRGIVYNGNGGGKYRGGERRSGGNKVSPNSKRSRVS